MKDLRQKVKDINTNKLYVVYSKVYYNTLNL